VYSLCRVNDRRRSGARILRGGCNIGVDGWGGVLGGRNNVGNVRVDRLFSGINPSSFCDFGGDGGHRLGVRQR